MLTVDMDGSQKLQHLMIGKFSKPRCFKNKNKNVSAQTIANCFKTCDFIKDE